MSDKAISIEKLYIDLPLVTVRDSASKKLLRTEEVLGVKPEQKQTVNEQEIISGINDELKPGARLILSGGPGCGKTTLLRFLTYKCAVQHLPESLRGDFTLLDRECLENRELSPDHPWLPITLLCRDLSDADMDNGLVGLIEHHFRWLGYRRNEVQLLVDFLEEQMLDGKVLLLIDGLDEISKEEQRKKFARLVAVQANRYRQTPIIITSRVLELNGVDSLDSFKHLTIAPIEISEKQKLIRAWAKLTTSSVEDYDLMRDELERHLAFSTSKLTKLCKNVFLLTLVIQIYLQDRELPDRMLEVYHRVVGLLIDRQRKREGLPLLEQQEIYPYIEHLAYCMQSDDVPDWMEKQVIETLEEVRRQEAEEIELQRRKPKEWLDAVIEQLGLLSIAALRKDKRGYERRFIRFFHQSFQEYFAAQAVIHGRGVYNEVESLELLRQHVNDDLTVEELKIEFLGSKQRTELVLTGRWIDVVRYCFGELSQDREIQENLGVTSIDDVVVKIFPLNDISAEKKRAFATFALQCLADYEPDLERKTLNAILDVAIAHINELDSYYSEPSTHLGKAFYAMMQSRFREFCYERLIQSYVQTCDYHRLWVGKIILRSLEYELLTVENASQVLEPLLESLITCSSVEASVEIALKLTEILFQAQVKIGLDFLAAPLLCKVVETLLTTVEERTEHSEAIPASAMFALRQLVGEKDGSPYIPYKFTEVELTRIRRIATGRKRDAYILSGCALILGICVSEGTVFSQTHWIYEWATVADGHKPHKHLPSVVSATSPENIETLKYLALANLPMLSQHNVALALGRLGCFIPEMVEPLIQIVQDDFYSQSLREEALVYLVFTGGNEVISFLTQKKNHSENRTNSNSDFYEFFPLALVGMGDLAILKNQLGLGEEDQMALNAFAYALEGAKNPEGRGILKTLASHESKQIRDAVTNAWSNTSQWDLLESRLGRFSFPIASSDTYVNRYISRLGHLVHKLKAKDSTGRWAYYFVLIFPDKEKSFMEALGLTDQIDLEAHGQVIASNYGEEPSEEVRNSLKERYGFDV